MAVICSNNNNSILKEWTEFMLSIYIIYVMDILYTSHWIINTLDCYYQPFLIIIYEQ